MNNTTKLLPKYKDTLIEVLESYGQCRSKLCAVDEETGETCFCIEGALLEAYRQVEGEGLWKHGLFVIDDREYGGYAPSWVFDSMFERDHIPYFVVEGAPQRPYILNDDCEVTFPEFIELIKEQW